MNILELRVAQNSATRNTYTLCPYRPTIRDFRYAYRCGANFCNKELLESLTKRHFLDYKATGRLKFGTILKIAYLFNKLR